MRLIKDSRPSPAIVIAVLALAVALAGAPLAGAGASPGALTKKMVIAIATEQANKQITKRAAHLSVANSNALEGKPASAFASASSEPYHEVNAPGEPTFQNGWSNYGSGLSTTAFYKDPLGVVRLKGVMSNAGNNSTACTLPPGYRPAQDLFLPTIGSGPTAGGIDIQPTGEVTPLCAAAPCHPTLDGLTFSAS
jgi:hypothetical protein